MNESKLELTHRLTREGRWAEAEQWKNAEIKRLRAEGMERTAAQTAAWESLADHYGPLPAAPDPPIHAPLVLAPPEEGAIDASQPPRREREAVRAWHDCGLDQAIPGDDVNVDVNADALWVYSHIGVSSIGPADAPNSGAGAMLYWARRNPERFYQSVLPKAIAAREAAADAEAKRAESARTLPDPADPTTHPEYVFDDMQEMIDLIAWHAHRGICELDGVDSGDGETEEK